MDVRIMFHNSLLSVAYLEEELGSSKVEHTFTKLLHMNSHWFARRQYTAGEGDWFVPPPLLTLSQCHKAGHPWNVVLMGLCRGHTTRPGGDVLRTPGSSTRSPERRRQGARPAAVFSGPEVRKGGCRGRAAWPFRSLRPSAEPASPAEGNLPQRSTDFHSRACHRQNHVYPRSFHITTKPW